MQDEGLEVRDVRAIAQTLGAGLRTELARSVEKQLRDLQSPKQKRWNASEPWPEPVSLWRGCWPMRKETDSCPVAVPRRGRGRHRIPQSA